MTQCDLIVTCDTSIAHLAGALARPVWVALKSDAEWRWMRERADSPWYPTMRLFRQSRRGVWSDVIDAMASELAGASSPRVLPRMIFAPCSIGELIDKITILRIKIRRMTNEDKLRNVRRELAPLEDAGDGRQSRRPQIESLTDAARCGERRLWDIEDDDPDLRAGRDFGSEFVALARSVYVNNDERAALKRAINRMFNSALVEEKSYA